MRACVCVCVCVSVCARERACVAACGVWEYLKEATDTLADVIGGLVGQGDRVFQCEEEVLPAQAEGRDHVRGVGESPGVVLHRDIALRDCPPTHDTTSATHNVMAKESGAEGMRRMYAKAPPLMKAMSVLPAARNWSAAQLPIPHSPNQHLCCTCPLAAELTLYGLKGCIAWSGQHARTLRSRLTEAWPMTRFTPAKDML
jgi:hypothetical protein